MAFECKDYPFTSRATQIERAIGRLEGLAFGRWLEFSAFGYGEQLRININGGGEVEGFREIPGLREFADNLNVAMRPVIAVYVAQLRQELANECVKIADKALRASPLSRPNGDTP